MRGEFRKSGSSSRTTTYSRRAEHRRQQLLLVSVTGVCFSFALILIFVFNFGADKPAHSAIEPGERAVVMVSLFVPERTVKEGEALSNVRLREIPWPRYNIPEDAVRDPGEVRGMTAKVQLSANEPLKRTFLTKNYIREGLKPAPGFRVMSISVDDTSSLEGHALPGTIVDVIVTYYNKGLLTSQIIVERARILSTDGNTADVHELTKAGATGRRSARTVSLEVNVESALKIEAAKQLGKLTLMMRNEDDLLGSPVREVTSTTINGGSHESAPASKCNLGKVRQGLREYIADCDGRLVEVTKDEP